MDGNTETTAHDHTARIARVAWLCAFVLPLILAMLLLGVKSADAAPPRAGSDPSAFEEEFEIEEESEAEFAEEECEIAEEEAEEGEITKAEADAICREAEAAASGKTTGPGSAAECPIHSDTAHASTHNDELKLTLGYTTNAPLTAVIQLSGVVKGSFKRHLGRSGVLRFTEKLDNKTRGRTVVHIKLPASEIAGCPSRRLVLFPG